MILILGIVGVLIALALVVTAFSIIVAVLGATVAVAVAALLGAAAGMLATAIAHEAGVADPGLWGAPAGIAVFLISAPLLLRRIFGTRTVDYSATVKVCATLPAPEPLEREAEVRGAWDRAESLVPKSMLAQVFRARADCAVLLDLAAGDTLDAGVIDLAAVVRRNVPALVRQVDALCRNVSVGERGELGHGLAEDLVRLGSAARLHVGRNRDSLVDGLAAIRKHVAARTGDA